MRDKDLIKLGKKIQILRTVNDMSQERLAELANMSVHGISNIENGKTDIKYTNLLQIAKAFNINPSSLIDL